MQSRVVVVVVNWNGGAYLKRCLEALANQTERNFSAIVVDNDSSDGSADCVEALGDSRFTLLRQGRNLGFAVANNLAVEQAPLSEWIALLNPDAFPEPAWLEQLMLATVKHADCAGFGSRLTDASDAALLDGTGDAYHFTGRAWRQHHGKPVSPEALQDREIFSPCAAAALYRRNVWEEVGGFDETYFCYLEDVDLGFRMRLMGYRFRYVSGAICHHVGSAVAGRRSDFATYHGQRNMVWTFVKDMPGCLFWLLLPAHILVNLIAVGMLAHRGQMRVVRRAKCDALRELPTVWLKRQEIQKARKASAGEIWRVLGKKIPSP